jgi:hypothetical protein
MISIPEAVDRADLSVFAERVLRLDETAVIRLRTRSDGLIGAWAATGFDVLVARVVAGGMARPDVTCGADALRRGLAAADEAGVVDPGYPMDSAWRSALPPETGFVHVDDVPTAVMAELARNGTDLAREHSGPLGPPASLLDQEVLQVRSGTETAAVPMRCALVLAAMGFAPDAPGEVVRVRVMPAWLRIDARFGSAFRRRGDPVLLLN